jgi:hypothetical protein
MTQPEAWDAYDRWQQDDRVELMNEPSGPQRRTGPTRILQCWPRPGS